MTSRELGHTLNSGISPRNSSARWLACADDPSPADAEPTAPLPWLEEMPPRQIVAELDFNGGDKDFKAQLTAIKATNPEVIFVPGYYNDIGQIAIQARDLGMNMPLVGGDGWDSDKLEEIGGDAVQGSYYSNHFAHDNPTPTAKRFIAAYRLNMPLVIAADPHILPGRWNDQSMEARARRREQSRARLAALRALNPDSLSRADRLGMSDHSWVHIQIVANIALPIADSAGIDDVDCRGQFEARMLNPAGGNNDNIGQWFDCGGACRISRAERGTNLQ